MTDWSFLEGAWSTLAARASSFVPTLFAAGLLLVFGWLIARLLSWLTSRLLKRIKMDSWLSENGVSYELGPGRTALGPTRVVSNLIFWLFFLSFVVMAMAQVGLELSALPVQTFIAYLPVVLGAVLLLVAGAVVATFLARGAETAMRGMGVEQAKRIAQVIKAMVLALTAVLVVEQLGFDVTTLTQTFSNLVVVVVGGLVLAFAWGGREVARNVLASHYIREHFKEGERIVVDGFEGELTQVGSLNCRLSVEGGEVVVPNSRMIEQTVVKKSG